MIMFIMNMIMMNWSEGELKMDKAGQTEGYGYPLAFVCTFCKQEFASISSVFSHMSEMHGSNPEESIEE